MRGTIQGSFLLVFIYGCWKTTVAFMKITSIHATPFLKNGNRTFCHSFHHYVDARQKHAGMTNA